MRRLIDEGDRLGMTSGDTVRLTTETLRALDVRGDLQPAIEDVVEAFDEGRLLTEVREPMNLYLDRSAVSALAVVVCEACRPDIGVRESNSEPSNTGEPVPTATPDESELGRERLDGETGVPPVQLEHLAHWPERTRGGFPQITLDVEVWWPGLPEWEQATLTAQVSQSLAFSGENLTLLIEQEGDVEPARTNSVWLLERGDLGEDVPVYELRASTWNVGDDDAHRYRFLVASSSPWCEELRDYLATRWISHGKSPSGPDEFDSAQLGGDHPPVRAFAKSPGKDSVSPRL
jgi:hypothetical protein